MARTPAAPAAAADTDPDPDQDQDQDQDDDQDQGYVIEIHVHADGTFSVEQEDEDEDEEDEEGQAGAAGETAPGGSDEEYTDIADALKAALKLYREHPVSGSDEAHFAAGYRSEGGPSTGPGGATQGKYL